MLIQKHLVKERRSYNDLNGEVEDTRHSRNRYRTCEKKSDFMSINKLLEEVYVRTHLELSSSEYRNIGVTKILFINDLFDYRLLSLRKLLKYNHKVIS